MFVVRSEMRREQVAKLFPQRAIYVCDVEQQSQIDALATQLEHDFEGFSGFVHSIAFADYSDGMHPFHETNAAASFCKRSTSVAFRSSPSPAHFAINWTSKAPLSPSVFQQRGWRAKSMRFYGSRKSCVGFVTGIFDQIVQSL